jgi:hypothetical protein
LRGGFCIAAPQSGGRQSLRARRRVWRGIRSRLFSRAGFLLCSHVGCGDQRSA